MSRNYGWGTKANSDNELLYVILFVSRNKDNQGIEGFKERRKAFLSTDVEFPTIGDKLSRQFMHFVGDGLPGEMSRCYCSVNDRNAEKIIKELMHYLIDTDGFTFNLCAIEPKLAGLAAMKGCANSKKWLFDFDNNNDGVVDQFIFDIKEIAKNIDITCLETPNGYAVITDRGFDTRNLLEKWGEVVTLKRDDLVVLAWQTKQ